MRCSRCEEKAVFSGPALCAVHLVEHVEQVVRETIDRFGLCSHDDHICVAASGGKDSLTVLSILHDLGYRVEALAVDEGIAGYRERTLADLRSFCQTQGIPLRVVSFVAEVGKPLDELAQGRHPCSVCGVFRRYLLNAHARGYDVVATGHNLDDEAQSVLMNIIKANHGMLLRSHVRTPPAPGFTPRIKPLFFLPERMILAYTLVKGLQVGYVECPHVPLALRAKVRDELNRYASVDQGIKRELVEAALHVAAARPPVLLQVCAVCGEPAAGSVCRACVLRQELVGDAP